MKIYTRTGDAGETALFGGGRVSKDHHRVAAYGMIDELNATVGVAVGQVADAGIARQLRMVQHDLFALGAILATLPREDGTPHPHVPEMPRARIDEMEVWMDEAETELPPLRQFVLPGGTSGSAALHLARTVCRRAERAVVHLGTLEAIEDDLVPYLNRLSDLLFTLARLDNRRADVPDVIWEK
ncbi:MAG: cob(I)yrinic acid a,c-diamide adenosyltransferase [Gemmatimonadetes bacterium]|nr:cob(I)yrinic acid a,c-diamide adenosyltransferase [Gemmatimonadota bacterium]NNF38985.1 cob(I)yrinic acid a,c-diamide adenosyltransferase [Gemmatimonadota bacterium]NNK63208.1 cob(I)yrinic acid a,c-diamide adenosyltransferase [Gemmatimonadota bacterium]